MADDVLTRAELETLLSARARSSASGPKDGQLTSRGGASQRETILPYGPGSTPRMDLAAERELFRMHERCGRQFAASLARQLRRTTDVKLLSVNQLTGREATLRLENPTCLSVLTAAPLAGCCLIEVQYAILYPWIDCLLGGGREPAAISRRPLTEIESRLAARVVELLRQELANAWTACLQVGLIVDRMESDPRRLEILPADEAFVWLSFEGVLGRSRGAIHLGIPQAIGQALASAQWVSTHDSAKKTANGSPSIPIGGDSQEAKSVQLVAQLARTTIGPDELTDLSVGDVITTEQEVGSPITLTIDGEPRFMARVGALHGRKAVQIEQALPATPSDSLPAPEVFDPPQD
jgi:flagellar motor switch protein FliM